MTNFYKSWRTPKQLHIRTLNDISSNMKLWKLWTFYYLPFPPRILLVDSLKGTYLQGASFYRAVGQALLFVRLIPELTFPSGNSVPKSFPLRVLLPCFHSWREFITESTLGTKGVKIYWNRTAEDVTFVRLRQPVLFSRLQRLFPCRDLRTCSRLLNRTVSCLRFRR